MGTQDARLLSLDAATGAPCAAFGVAGEVDLASGRGEFKPGEYGVSSPPVIVGRNLIIGGRVADNVRLDIPAGLIRAFDVDTGALVWAWNPVPPGRPEKIATETGEVYVSGTTNSWTVMSADVERGLVYVPTGNTSPDFFGGLRDGLDYYSSSVVALDAATGRVVWHFQTVHHDLWDYDVPAAAGALRPADGGRDRTRARAADEAGPSVRAEPRHRRAAVPGRGTSGAADGGCRRDPCADAAVSRR